MQQGHVSKYVFDQRQVDVLQPRYQMEDALCAVTQYAIQEVGIRSWVQGHVWVYVDCGPEQLCTDSAAR